MKTRLLILLLAVAVLLACTLPYRVRRGYDVPYIHPTPYVRHR